MFICNCNGEDDCFMGDDGDECDGDEYTERVIEIANEYGIEDDEAEEVLELSDELGIDEDEAFDIYESM